MKECIGEWRVCCSFLLPTLHHVKNSVCPECRLSHRTERTVRHQLSQHQQCTMALTISSSLLYLATAFLFSAAVFVFILPCCFEGRIHPQSSRVYLEKSFFFCSIRFGYPVGLGIWFHFSVILSSPCGITHSIATGILPLK